MHVMTQFFSEEAAAICSVAAFGAAGVAAGVAFGFVRTATQYRSIIDEIDSPLAAMFTVSAALGNNIWKAAKILGVSGVLVGAVVLAPKIAHADIAPTTHAPLRPITYPTSAATYKF